MKMASSEALLRRRSTFMAPNDNPWVGTYRQSSFLPVEFLCNIRTIWNCENYGQEQEEGFYDFVDVNTQ